MYLLDYLKKSGETPKAADEVEYRFVCSDCLYPEEFLGDWSRSDGARLLLYEPFGFWWQVGHLTNIPEVWDSVSDFFGNRNVRSSC